MTIEPGRFGSVTSRSCRLFIQDRRPLRRVGGLLLAIANLANLSLGRVDAGAGVSSATDADRQRASVALVHCRHLQAASVAALGLADDKVVPVVEGHRGAACRASAEWSRGSASPGIRQVELHGRGDLRRQDGSDVSVLNAGATSRDR